MAVSPQIFPQVVESNERGNIRAADLLANDLEPVCPSCYDIADAASVTCATCGTHLTANQPRIAIPVPWSTSA